MPATAAGWTALAAVATVGVVTYTAVEQKSQAKKAKSEAKKGRLLAERQQGFYEMQAGEYYELTGQQMELQSQMSTIKTLSTILEERGRPQEPLVVTLPAAKEYSTVDRINQAIDDFVKGG